MNLLKHCSKIIINKAKFDKWNLTEIKKVCPEAHICIPPIDLDIELSAYVKIPTPNGIVLLNKNDAVVCYLNGAYDVIKCKGIKLIIQKIKDLF